MSRLNYLLVFPFSLIVVTSCDNREDYFEGVNKAPTLTVYSNGVEVSSSEIIDSLKIGSPQEFSYYISDEEKVSLVDHQDQGSSQVDIADDKIKISGLAEGQSRIKLLVKDSFGAKAEFYFNFTVFMNLKPVTAFTMTRIAIASPFEFEVDASASYDKDSRFNGKIVEYEYTLQNYTFTTSLNKIRYIFGSNGQKKISVRVKDNSGEWSEIKSEYIVLE